MVHRSGRNCAPRQAAADWTANSGLRQINSSSDYFGVR